MRVANAVGGDLGEIPFGGEVEDTVILRFSGAVEMALEFGVDIAGAEDVEQRFDGLGAVCQAD